MNTVLDFLFDSRVYVMASAINYGFIVAYFQRRYPLIAAETYVEDRFLAALCAALGGPFGLCVTFFMGWHKHGWMA